jgi:hypothetical protein
MVGALIYKVPPEMGEAHQIKLSFQVASKAACGGMSGARLSKKARGRPEARRMPEFRRKTRPGRANYLQWQVATSKNVQNYTRLPMNAHSAVLPAGSTPPTVRRHRTRSDAAPSQSRTCSLAVAAKACFRAWRYAACGGEAWRYSEKRATCAARTASTRRPAGHCSLCSAPLVGLRVYPTGPSTDVRTLNTWPAQKSRCLTC